MSSKTPATHVPAEEAATDLSQSQRPSRNSSRLFYWDNCKGALILLVVLGHFLYEYRAWPYILPVVTVIYAFHMPAFLFISGYFSRSERSSSPEALFKLLVWFAVMNYSMMAIGYGLGTLQSFSVTDLVYSSWYLLALFLYRLILPAVRNRPSVIPLSILLSLAVGFVHRSSTILLWPKMVALLPFFLCGALLPKEHIDNVINLLTRRRALASLAGVVVSACTLFLILRHKLTLADVLWAAPYPDWRGVVHRATALLMAASITLMLFAFIPRTQLPALTKWGCNSLSVYVSHRVFTVLLALWFPQLLAHWSGYALLLLVSLVSLLVFGSDLYSRPFTRMLDALAAWLAPRGALTRASIRVAAVLFVAGLVCGLLLLPSSRSTLAARAKALTTPDRPPVDVTYPVISPVQWAAVQNSVSLSFVGDLILLRDQVYRAYDPSKRDYDFDPLFEYTKNYVSGSDLSIGVLEGPMAGPDVEYSTSRYSDGIPVRLNFPDSFARSIAASGIDFVTTANNHVLDGGVRGAIRTLDVLDRAGLRHIGSYRSPTEKSEKRIALVEVKGLRIALLGYTYAVNGYGRESLEDPEQSYVTSVLAAPDSPRFARSKESVLRDLQRARAMNPDAIVVLPHIGTQFSHSPDSYEKTWTDIFVAGGADIVVADHAHAVQPIEWRQGSRPNRRALIVYCPGNYVNSYMEKDGDAAAIVYAYLDRESGSPQAAAVVPVWGQAMMNGNFRALPIYQILRNPSLQREISDHDLNRVREVHSLVTRIMLGHDLSLDQIQEKYFLFPEGYARAPVPGINVDPPRKQTQLYRMLANAGAVCFVGDSVTAGTRNGGYGWQEPLTATLPDLKVHRKAWGSYTARMLLDHKDEIAAVPADVYVIAIGTNDVRYRSDKSSRTPEEYVSNIDTLITYVRTRRPQARFVLIGAWTTDHYDPISVLPEKERMAMLAEYRTALERYAHSRGHLYIDPNPGIESMIRTEYAGLYLKDPIHPNADRGIRLYSTKVLEASPLDAPTSR